IGEGWLSLSPPTLMPGCRNQFGECDQSSACVAYEIVDRTSCRSGWVNIIGGCCGTTPAAYSRVIAETARSCSPARLSLRYSPHVHRLSGLEALARVSALRPTSCKRRRAEDVHVSGSLKFARLIQRGQLR
ncbi:MAG: hypothetical protein MZV63_50400, partial [Marinilabiliales bacterium]|nr:hypothetical protein [Marinilabiliales bacterium]